MQRNMSNEIAQIRLKTQENCKRKLKLTRKLLMKTANQETTRHRSKKMFNL